ncbi:MAG TPA: isocitrate lyase/phosphoenolpyruvate mutase family protein [Verrucomicrobiae bacterium]|jgi:2-methylisocitrate lyase-like PEP mutase family enzyme
MTLHNFTRNADYGYVVVPKLQPKDDNRMVDLAEQFHSLHKRRGIILMLAIAWDARRAKTIEDTGAEAIATTSAGISRALGYRKDAMIPAQILGEAVTQITKIIRIPLSIEFETSYTNDRAQFGETLKTAIDSGVVGVNIEDGLFPPSALAKKIERARHTSEALGINLFINARTDVYLAKIGDPDERLMEAIKRGLRYREAGADGIFVPGLADPASIGAIVEQVKLPVNILAASDLPPIAELRRLGVRRLSSNQEAPREILAAVKGVGEGFIVPRETNPLLEESRNHGHIQNLFSP